MTDGKIISKLKNTITPWLLPAFSSIVWMVLVLTLLLVQVYQKSFIQKFDTLSLYEAFFQNKSYIWITGAAFIDLIAQKISGFKMRISPLTISLFLVTAMIFGFSYFDFSDKNNPIYFHGWLVIIIVIKTFMYKITKSNNK